MSLEEKSGLINQTSFAKRCGVSASTIRAYVNEHRITPASEVGDRVFFTEDQIYDVKALSVKRFINQSFLCLVCEGDEVSLKTTKERMLLDINSVCPSAVAIESLSNSAKSMTVGYEVTPTSEVLLVIKSKVVSAFISEVKSAISGIICDVFADEPAVRSFPFSFFLGYVSGQEVDSALVDRYLGLGITNLSHTLEKIEQRCQLSFDGIAKRYGVFVVCNSTNFGIWEAFNEDGSSLLSAENFKFDSFSPSAKAIYEKTLRSSSGDRVAQGLLNICRAGFYCFVDSVDAFSNEVCADVITKLLSGEFKTVYVSSYKTMPVAITTVLDGLVKNGLIRVEILQG